MKAALEKSYDVMVIGKLRWTLLPTAQRFQVLEKVYAGAGLVYINPPETHRELEIVMENGPIPTAGEFITGGVPLAELPALRRLPVEKLVRAARFGKGRVVILDYAEKVPKDVAWPCLTPAWEATSETKPTGVPPPLNELPEVQWVPYEYYQSLVAKALAWAAGKESSVRIRLDLPASLPWPVAGKVISVTATNTTGKTLLRATVRDRYDRTLVYELAAKERRRAAAIFGLPDLPCGEYFLDVLAMTAAGKTTQTWSSTFFTVADEFVFGTLSLKNGILNAGDKLEGTLILPRALREDERLFLDLSDKLGRRLVTQAVPTPSSNAAFALTLPPPLTTLHRVEVRLERGTAAYYHMKGWKALGGQAAAFAGLLAQAGAIEPAV